jgi:hypothetical protein
MAVEDDWEKMEGKEIGREKIPNFAAITVRLV